MDGSDDWPERERKGVRFDEMIVDGFKSFADRVRLRIEPGLTGIVGPNGCGKSNVTESLRWALGETSSKRLRGDGMEQMIFGGSEKRPPRSWCEVTLVLDNVTRNAPPGMNETDQIRIVRRIDRGGGGSYKVNGRSARLKDISLLFRDNATGPSSGSIIGQSRVAELMKSKPEERSFVLADASGVSGILQRRREAELELKASEDNLGKADEAMSSTTARVATLRRQARQVERLRAVEDEIAAVRLRLARHEKATTLAALAESRARHEANEGRVKEAILDERAKAARQEEAMRRLPALRTARSGSEAAAAEAATRLALLQEERKRLEAAAADARTRTAEARRDLLETAAAETRETARLEARTADRSRLAREKAEEPEAIGDAAELAETTADARTERERSLEEVLSAGAARTAARNEAQRRRTREIEALSTCERSLEKARGELASARRVLDAAPDPSAAADEIAGLETDADGLADATAAIGERRIETRARLAEIGTRRAETEGTLAALLGEERVLAASTGDDRAGAEGCEAHPGFETAVAAALGTLLSASDDADADRHWAEASDAPPTYPAGTVTLKDRAVVRPYLATAFASVAVVDDEGFEAFAARLPRGGAAVTREGRLATWNGWRSSGADPVVAERLRRANRLREIAAERIGREADLRSTAEESARVDALDRKEAAAEAALAARSREVQVRLVDLGRARLAADAERQRAALSASSLAASVERLAAERTARLDEVAACDEILAANAADAAHAAAETEARTALDVARKAASEAALGLDRLTQEQRARQRLIEQAAGEMAAAERAIAECRDRRARIEDRLAELAVLAEALPDPAEADAVLAEAADGLASAAETARSAAEALVAAESEREEADRQLRETTAVHAALLESRSRFQESIGRAMEDAAKAGARLAERVGDAAADDPGETMPPEQVAIDETRLAELDRSRLSIGAVNHLAETELKEHEGKLGDIEKARKETVEAIRTLRKAIVEIEDEARRRMAPTFESMNDHFGSLFKRIFNGGEARLGLTGDDILTAGLEVFIQPPGKLMQSLSLFSGGERALSSIALIFSAFLVNPSPICVLDEADADLDQPNRIRLYDLVRHMAEGDSTRFVVISHDPVAMAKMDRLYGVTMQEGGVSMLTTVDLDRVAELLPTGPAKTMATA